MNALTMTALDAATDARAWTLLPPAARIAHTPQPTPAVDDEDEDDDEKDDNDRGSGGGNIDPDEDEGWSEEDDDDDDESGWSAADARDPGHRRGC
jgi:hypothetical protein